MPAEPHPLWIEELLKNNHSPSDQAVREIKGYLTIPLQELGDLDAKILALKIRLSELESKRDETQKRISQYKSILAPIRRIPADVLGEIFLHCLPTHRNPIIKSTECPLLLTHICKPWQAVAISSPRLWERIYITFTDDDTVPDLESAAEMVRNGRITGSAWQSAQPKSEKERTTALLRRRYEAIREWVSRSGTRPLSISLSFPSTFWYNVPYSMRPPSLMMEFLSFLATLAPRLKHLELKISPEIYDVLERMIKPAQMTALTSLRVEYPSYFPIQRERTLHPTLFHAPRLQTIFMAIGGNITRGIDSSIRWNQLTRILCLDLLTFAQTVELFQRSSNLVHYKGIISDSPQVIAPLPLLHDEGYISLPFLQSLSITQYASPQRAGNMYDRIDAPSLKSFSYAVEFFAPRAGAAFSTNTPGTGAPTAVNSILPLLQKSTELQKLTIDMNHSIAGDISTLVDAIPSITELVIGFPERYGALHEFLPWSQTGYDTHGFPERDIWGFGNFIVREDSKDDKPPLLPRLTSLVILSPNARISDETLLDLIKSRMISGRTAALEHVKLNSSRKREKDIEGEVARYANLVGGKIRLDLTYPQLQPPTSGMKFISPEFGLSEFADNRRSWRYIDAGGDDYV